MLAIIFWGIRRFPTPFDPATRAVAIPAISAVAIMLLIMACCRQSLSPDAPWWHNVRSFWPFALSYLWMTAILGLETIKNLSNLRTARLSVTLNHTGLFIVLLFGALGASDVENLTVPAVADSIEWNAQDSEGRLNTLHFGIELIKINEAESNDSTAKPGHIAAEIIVYRQNPSAHSLHTLRINHPIKIQGWAIYLSDYAIKNASRPDFAILTLVRDPWLPTVYSGIFLMGAGALLTIFSPRGRKLKHRNHEP
ncbi:MAG: cytochrome c biogenesis protein ResB [Muribaculum sp.]|nr:cytochrome c biogenesis protein ResB [Muribaculum sp.]